MRAFLTVIAAAIGCAAATQALAAPTRLTDVQYMQASRCLGLMTSKALATPDAGPLAKYLQSQDWARSDYIESKADEMRQEAQHEASSRDAGLLTRLTAERDGACHAFLADWATTASGGGPSPAPSTLR